jgi:hypothetical protein
MLKLTEDELKAVWDKIYPDQPWPRNLDFPRWATLTVDATAQHAAEEIVKFLAPLVSNPRLGQLKRWLASQGVEIKSE